MKSLRVFAIVAVAAAAATLPAAGASAATLHPTREFTTPVVSVTTTTGAHVHLAIDMIRDGDTSIEVDLNKSSRSYMEDHAWSFDISDAALSYSKGKGTLQTYKHLGPYGSLRLSFTKVAQATRSCQNDVGAATKVTSVAAKVRGVVVFKARSSNTQSSKWGAVRKGTSTSPYYFGGHYAHYVTSTNGRCAASSGGASGNPECMSGTFWDGPMVGVSSMRLVTGGSEEGFGAQILGLRMVGLSYPSGAMRMDAVGATAPAPVLDTTGAQPVLNVTTTPGSAASGTATLTATAAPTVEPTSPCTKSGTTKTQSISDYETADYTNGSTPLTIASMVGSNITVPNAVGQANFSTFSYA